MEQMMNYLLTLPGVATVTCRAISQLSVKNQVIGKLWVIEIMAWSEEMKDHKWITIRAEGKTLGEAQQDLLGKLPK